MDGFTRNERTKFVAKIIGYSLLQFADIATDSATLPGYWKAGTLKIFYAALVFVIFSLPFSVGQILLGILQYRNGDEKSYDEKQTLLSLLEVLTESIPMLVIHLIFLSICGEEVGVVQYAAVSCSCISIAARMFTIEVDTGEKTLKMFGMYLFIYTAKLFYTAARVLALAYFCFYLGWWILVLFAIRWSCFAMYNFCAQNSTKVLFFAVFSHTLAFGPFPDGILALLVPLWTCGENMVLAVTGYEYSSSDEYKNRTEPFAGVAIKGANSTAAEFCLYSHPLALHGSLNSITAFFVICVYFLSYQKKDDSLFEEEFILTEMKTDED